MPTMRSPTDLSALLKGRRLELGESQALFAARIGRTQAWVSAMERDGIPNVYVSTALEVLAAAGLEVTVRAGVPAPRPSGPDPEGDFATTLDDDGPSGGPFP